MKHYLASARDRICRILKCKWICRNAAMLFIFFTFLLNISGSAVQKNEFWKTKDYRSWTEKECETMLADSPWAKNLLYNSYGYVVQLLSALPIRQALVRQKQIAVNYGRLSQEKRKEADKGAEALLSERFPDTIVVRIISGRHLGRNALGKPESFPCRNWHDQTTETLKNTVYLIPSKGDRIPLERFVLSGPNVCEFRFIFPRHIKGRTVPSEDDKFLRLEFTGIPAWSMNQNPERTLFEFKLSDMKFNGDTAY